MTSYARQLWDTVRSWVWGPGRYGELQRWFEGNTGVSTVPVSEETALTLSAVWNAVQLISGSVASLPLMFYKRTGDGDREVMRGHPLYALLHDAPNADMSAMDFRQTMQQHVLNWGNAFAEITRNGAGRVAELYPIHPSRVSLHRDGRGALYYEVTNSPEDRVTRLRADQMLHIKGPSPDGLWGYSVIGKARESMGYTLRSEQYGSAFYANSSSPGSIVTHPGGLSTTAHARLLHDLEARHKGGPNSFRLALLEEGMKWEPWGIPPVDAQFLESRTFQVLEVCRWYNIQPHKLKEMTHATFTNIEHQALEFVQDTLLPWLVKTEQELNRKLIQPSERFIQYFEHNVEGLLRGDTESRYRAYATGINWGFLTPNVVARKENLPPLPEDQNGDAYLVPANMIARAKLLDDPTPPPAAIPAPPAQAEIVEEEDEEEVEEVEEEAAALPAPTVETRALVEAPASPESNGHPDPRSRAHVITAQRALIADVVRRTLAREKDKARTAATHGRPERLRAWIGEFYPRHADYFSLQLRPVVQLHLALTASAEDPEARTRQLVEAHVAESKRQLYALAEQRVEDLQSAVEDLMLRWDLERLNTIPDALLVEEISHGV